MIFPISVADDWTTEDFRRVVENHASIYFDRPGRASSWGPLAELSMIARTRWGWFWIWEMIVEEQDARRKARRELEGRHDT